MMFVLDFSSSNGFVSNPLLDLIMAIMAMESKYSSNYLTRV